MISYPSNWISVPGNDGSIMFRAPAESFSDNYVNAAVLVMSESLPSQSNTLQALTEHKLKSYSIQTPDDRLIQSQEIFLAGLPAHMVEVQLLNVADFLVLDWSFAKLMAFEVWTVKGDKWYDVLFVAPVEKYAQYFPIAQQMINSFQVLG